MERVAVVGAAGRMGSAVCRAVTEDPELALVAAIDPGRVGGKVGDLTVEGDIKAALESDATVVVDFTTAEAARENLPWCAQQGLHAVVGTTGLGDDDVERIGDLFQRSDANCIIAPNFAIGAVLMMHFAERAAPFFDSAEVIELHHDNKADAPSGTALATARRMVAASDTWADDPTQKETIPGSRGADVGGVRVHAVRMRGMVAHQEVTLGTTGQTLTIRHDSYDRMSFMPGVLLAVKAVSDRPGLTYGLESILGL